MPDIFDKVRVKETGDIGMIVAVMSKRQPKPYAVRVTAAADKDSAASFSHKVYFSEDELELVEGNKDHPEPARQPPPQTQLDRIEADGVEMRLTLAIVHAEVNAIARAIERRPTGWQLFWIGFIASLALSAAMEIAGDWS